MNSLCLGMAKELYLYSHIYDFVAESFISQMEENRSEDIVIRGNTPGGNVFAGWGMIAKIKEHEGNVKMKVDGYVASMGTIVLTFVDDTEALDVSRIHLHRADGYVNSPEDQAFLDGINKDLRAKLTLKIDAAKLKELKGVTIDDLFNPDKVTDVWLTAKEAKQIGLIKKIVKITPTEIAAINRMNIAASINPLAKEEPVKDSNETKVKTNMTLEELKAQHPALYAQAVSEGKTSGSTEERERINAWEAWRNVDAEFVDKNIKEGKAITTNDISLLTAKKMSPEFLAKLTASAPPVLETKPEDGKVKTEKEKGLADFMAEVNANLGRKTEVKS
jgi:ATP-dependent protease ClpP protease subunit